jgi:hypothetical protein
VDKIRSWRIGEAKATTYGDQLAAVESAVIHAVLDDLANRSGIGFPIELQGFSRNQATIFELAQRLNST